MAKKAKMKTKHAAAKRYHVTGGGKVTFKKQGLRHILTKKNAKQKRRLRIGATLSPVETKRVKQLLPYAMKG
jgi:large subunit ribosomal protein L35